MKKLFLGMVLVLLVAGGIAVNYESNHTVSSTLELACEYFDNCETCDVHSVKSWEDGREEILNRKTVDGITYMLVKTGDENYRIMTENDYNIWRTYIK